MKWVEYKISDFCEVGRGSSPRPIADKTYFEDGSIPWVKIADATASGKYIYSTREHVNEYGASFSRHLDAGSLIIAASGVSLGQIKLLGTKGCIHDGWLYLSNYKEELIDREFLYYYLILISSNFHDLSYGAAIQNINTDILKNIRIKLPPLQIQHRIAEVLGRYDALIAIHERQIRNLEAAARTLYREWFVRGRCPLARYEADGESPIGWERLKVEDCFEILGGGTPSSNEPAYWEDGDVNWYTPTDVTAAKGIFLKESSEKISEAGYKKSSARLFPAYSVMMTSRATIGATAINTEPATTNQGFITCLPNERFSFAFIYYWVLTNKPIFEMLASGATFLEITKGTFKDIELIVPTEDVLRAFDKVVLPFFYKIENLQSQISALRRTRDKLLPRLIRGQIPLMEHSVISHGELHL
jgi:type I restriction enzyme S subunit